MAKQDQIIEVTTYSNGDMEITASYDKLIAQMAKSYNEWEGSSNEDFYVYCNLLSDIFGIDEKIVADDFETEVVNYEFSKMLG